MARFRRIAACAASALVVGCGEERPLTPASVGDSAPRLSDALQTNCYSWPAQAFTRDNHAIIGVALSEGERAVEFELRDVHGGEHRLSELLATKPVLMVTGSHT